MYMYIIHIICNTVYNTSTFCIAFFIHSLYCFCSVEDIDDLMPLIQQHCCVLPSCTNTSAIDDSTLIESVTSQVYDLKSIQKVIHAKYIAKMKQVQQPNYELSWVYKDEEESVTNLL